MKVKYLCSKLENSLKEKFPDVPLTEIYFSRRRKHIHFAFEKTIFDSNIKNFLEEVERFYDHYLEKDFEMLKPMRIIHTIKWKSDYIVFRKRRNRCKGFL